MNWKQIGLNLLVMAVVYCLMYGISYFFSRRWAIKRSKEKQEKK